MVLDNNCWYLICWFFYVSRFLQNTFPYYSESITLKGYEYCNNSTNSSPLIINSIFIFVAQLEALWPGMLQKQHYLKIKIKCCWTSCLFLIITHFSFTWFFIYYFWRFIKNNCILLFKFVNKFWKLSIIFVKFPIMIFFFFWINDFFQFQQ